MAENVTGSKRYHHPGLAPRPRTGSCWISSSFLHRDILKQCETIIMPELQSLHRFTAFGLHRDTEAARDCRLQLPWLYALISLLTDAKALPGPSSKLGFFCGVGTSEKLHSPLTRNINSLMAGLDRRSRGLWSTLQIVLNGITSRRQFEALLAWKCWQQSWWSSRWEQINRLMAIRLFWRSIFRMFQKLAITSAYMQYDRLQLIDFTSRFDCIFFI